MPVYLKAPLIPPMLDYFCCSSRPWLETRN